MYKSLLEAIFKAMITYGGTSVFDNIEQSKESFSFVLKSNKALDKGIKRCLEEIIGDGYFSMFALYKITNMAELQSVSHMLSTRVYNEILIREDVVDEIFDSFVVVFYDLIIKNLNKPKAITTYLEKREDTIISLLDNFGILQVGMPLFLQCEKQNILVCIKINSRTIVIGYISDDVVNDFDLIDSYLDYNCILKDFKVYENKTSNIIIELRRGQIVSQNRDTDEIDLSDEPNEELPFDDNYSENDVKTIKNLLYDYNSDCDYGLSSDYGYYEDECMYPNYNIEDMVDYSEDADDYMEYLMDH